MSPRAKSPAPPKRQLSLAEQEAEKAAQRLNTQIEAALSAVQAHDGTEELEACADRLERAARDLTVALRELAQRRQGSAASK